MLRDVQDRCTHLFGLECTSVSVLHHVPNSRTEGGYSWWSAVEPGPGPQQGGCKRRCRSQCSPSIRNANLRSSTTAPSVDSCPYTVDFLTKLFLSEYVSDLVDIAHRLKLHLSRNETYDTHQGVWTASIYSVYFFSILVEF